ncbi:A1pp-domain-containing protein, partial [Corynespora cassiicola Philippines]
MTQSSLSAAISASLRFLLNESFSAQQARRYIAHASHSETHAQLHMLHQLLCQRPAIPPLPSEIISAIDRVLSHQRDKKILTSAPFLPVRHSIPRTATTSDDSTQARPDVRLKLWKGDITTLTDVTAVVNAANSNLLGCFQPSHKCIDNVLHAAAGPQLRSACNDLMDAQGHAPEAVGKAKVTPGFNLPAEYVVHTVGPSLEPGSTPTAKQKAALAECYTSVLSAVESLPSDDEGRLSVAFCCISTGLFSFPGATAAGIAVSSVIDWLSAHPETRITDVIFNVFTPDDLSYYSDIFQHLEPDPQLPLTPKSPLVPPQNLRRALGWLQEADALLLTAGAGLSAAAGLDYTSPAVFNAHYAPAKALGLRRLYDIIGFSWPTPELQWGFWVRHHNTATSWPESEIYTSLLRLARAFDASPSGQDITARDVFVRTTNADNLFARHAFPKPRLSTPQGSYTYLQCLSKCRRDAYTPFAPIAAALAPHIDPATLALSDPSLIPTCQFCGGEMTLCVRGGSYFNQAPFAAGEEAYAEFLERAEENGQKVVVLELGVGMNTPGVLRWADEELVEGGEGRVKLVRAGLGPSSIVPEELEEAGLAVGVEGGCGEVVEWLVG